MRKENKISTLFNLFNEGAARELMNALAGSVMKEKKKLNKVDILFSLHTKSVLVAS